MSISEGHMLSQAYQYAPPLHSLTTFQSNEILFLPELKDRLVYIFTSSFFCYFGLWKIH